MSTFFSKAHSDALKAAQDTVGQALRDRQYKVTQYVSSILAQKTCSVTRRMSELKVHFPTSHGFELFIDHAIIHRGKASQKVKTIRVRSTFETLIAHLIERADLPVCFSSVEAVSNDKVLTQV